MSDLDYLKNSFINIEEFGPAGDCKGFKDISATEFEIHEVMGIDGKLSIIGNYASITADILDKTKPLFLIKNNTEEEICNLHLYGNYICKAGIEFQQPDNQMLTIKNVNISFFRHGLFCEQPECLNRLIIDKFDLLTIISYLRPHMGGDYHFTYSENNNLDYILKGISDIENPDFSNACYIKKLVSLLR